jgi:hypothetical protein
MRHRGPLLAHDKHHGEARRQPAQNAKPPIRRRAARGDAPRGFGRGRLRAEGLLAGLAMGGFRDRSTEKPKHDLRFSERKM